MRAGARAWSWLAWVLSLGLAASARADGAFPDSQSILLPSSRPEQILLSTNFGLLRSDDAGASWRWVCEEAIGPSAYSYQVGPAPDHRLFAVTSTGLAVSDDQGCSFRMADGLKDPSDVFPDPGDPLRVLAVGKTPAPEPGRELQAVFASNDGGASFTLAHAADAGVYISGLEIARSDRDVMYLTTSIYQDRGWRPGLERSADAGEHFAKHELLDQLGSVVPLLLAVDPTDPNRVYLRLQASGELDQFAIYAEPAGLAFRPFDLGARMSAFLLRSDGALLAASSTGANFISTDHGESFGRWDQPLHLRALAERDGQLYLAADELMDGVALAVSSDGGTTTRPLLRFEDVAGPLQCGDLPTRCELPWLMLQTSLLGPAEGVPDAGAPTAPPKPAPAPAGGCATVAPGPGLGRALWLLALLLPVWHRRRFRLAARAARDDHRRYDDSASAPGSAPHRAARGQH